MISGIVIKFAKQLAGALGGFIASNTKNAKSTGAKAAAKGGRGRRRRVRALCYYPGCKNLAAPRFGMFCAADHKNISKADKEKYRALHNKKAKAK